MKSHRVCGCAILVPVAPCVGAWVEISKISKSTSDASVAPCVGAWVEMMARFEQTRC